MNLPPAKALGKTLAEFLDILEIDEQASIQTEDFGTYASYHQSGISVLLRDKIVSSIFLYADGYDGYSGYSGDLGKLRLDSSKQIVRFLFGQPSVIREDPDTEVLGTPLIYDRYDHAEASYHFQYDNTGKRLRVLTIMSAERALRLGE